MVPTSPPGPEVRHDGQGPSGPAERGRLGPSGSATASFQVQTQDQVPGPVVALMGRIEAAERIDRFGRPLQRAADALTRSPGRDAALRGAWLGHALHPLLTDFPLGSWMSASFLDLFAGPDARGAARRLVGFGLLVAAPTAATGLAEWRASSGTAVKRAGVVHAAVNTTATVLYGFSWVARHRGADRLAVRLGVGGGVVATLGGYIGGHLSLVRKIGTADTAFGPDVEAITA